MKAAGFWWSLSRLMPPARKSAEAVIKMAEHTWLAKRALQMQEHCFTLEPTPPEAAAQGGQLLSVRADDLEKWIRYHAARDRAYRRASQDFLQLRNQRIKEARGPARQSGAVLGYRAEFAKPPRRRCRAIFRDSQKRAEAAEERKSELDAERLATAKARRQYDELRTAKAFAAILPPDFATNGQMPPLPPGFDLAAPGKTRF